MKCFRHSNFIPVVIFLSLLLAGFMYVVFRGAPAPSVPATEEEIVVIDEEAYQQKLADIMQAFDESMASAQDDQARLLAVETAISSILDVRVPAQYKDVHLGLVIALNEMQTTLKTQPNSMDDSILQKVQAIESENSWLAQ